MFLANLVKAFVTVNCHIVGVTVTITISVYANMPGVDRVMERASVYYGKQYNTKTTSERDNS